MEKDIRETGAVGLRYDSNRGLGQTNTDSNPFMPFLHKSGTNINATVNQYAGPSREYIGEELANFGVGDSQYDEELSTMSQAANLNEFRAQAQPWYDQIANGALKMITTAATTFVDGTLGALWGLGTGLKNLADDDPNTGFWRGMWDNDVTNAMAEVNDSMEKIATNYRSEWEQNASVFERMFSAEGAANFWGDDILKNAGFTMGAAASIWATGAAGNALKGLGLGRIAQGLGLLAKGEQGLEATQAGKTASWIAKTFASTQGEAAIESLNSARQSLKAMDAEIASMRQSGEQDIQTEFETNVNLGMDIESALAISKARTKQLDSELKAYENQMQRELSKAGNMIYAANIAALSVSNNLTLGSMIRGGYGNAKSLLKQATKTANGTPINTAKEAGEALLKGELRFTAPEVEHKVAKTLGRWALTSTQEGLEEGVQNLASNTGQIAAAARTHQWAKDNTMLDTMINADAEDDLASYSNALGKAFEEQFGSLNSPGWTEVVAGFLTGALGVASVHKNAEGKIRPTWQGGLKESWEDITGNQKAVQARVDALNEALTTSKFNERARHAVQQIAIKKGQEDALERGDIKAYKNLEIQQLLSDAVFFRDMGMLDDYLAMYEAMASGVTDQDVAELKAAAKQEDGEASSLETMSDDDIKALYRDKANSTLEKVKQALDDYKAIEDQYGDKFSDETRREATMEMSFLNTLYWDTQRRAQEVEQQRDELLNKKRTPLEDEELKRKEAALKALNNQATETRDTLNEYKNNPEKLQQKIEKRQLDRFKTELYKKAEAAIAKYKEASTLQDIVDIYSHSPEEDREQVLNQAIEQADGETKEKLQKFKNYMGDVNTLEHVIADRFPLDNAEQAPINLRKRAAFISILNDAVNEMLAGDSDALTRETLKDKLNEKLQEFSGSLAEQEAEANGVVASENGTLDFNAAFDSGAINMDDFDKVLDDESTGEYHLQIKEGSQAEKMADAAQNARQYKELINDLNYFVDSLDKLDELREAAKKKSNKKTVKKKGEPAVEVETFEGDEEEPEDFDDGGEVEEGTEGTEGESKSKTSRPKESALLTEEERSAYKVKSKKGASGVVYNTITKKSGPENKKAKASVSSKFSATDIQLKALMANFDSASDSKKAQIIDRILDIVSNNLISGKTINDVEKFLQENSKYLKADSEKEGALPPFKDKEANLASSDVSLNGNQHNAYVKSLLNPKEDTDQGGKLVPVTYQKSGEEPLQVWLEKNGFNIQHIIDNYLGKIVARDAEKGVKDKTPVHYIHCNEQPDVIFLGIDYSQVESIIPRDVARKLIQGQDGKNYLLIGTLGWESAREGTKDMFETILNDSKDGEHTSDGWHVNPNHTNRIKDIQAGYRVKQMEKDDSPQVRNLNELLQDPSRNPHGLELEDFSWTVIEGKEDAPKRKIVNGEDQVGDIYAVSGGRPGQVYLNIPAANGKYIPIYIETIFFDGLNQDTPLYREIIDKIRILADPNTTIEDKKSAIAQLSDYLVFSKGVNQIHLNDSKSKIDPDTIYVTRNGQPVKVLDFHDDIDVDTATSILLEEIKTLNPRINIAVNVLANNPRLYLDSEVLKTDIAMLGTAGSSFFVYPVDSEGEYVENKPFKGTFQTYSAPVKNRIYVAGKYVYYDGHKFTDEKGNTIDDEDGTLDIAQRIKAGKVKPIQVGKSKANYYVVDGAVYVDNGHGGIEEVEDELAAKVLEAAKNKKVKGTKKAAVKKEAGRAKKRKKEAPTDDSRLRAETPEADEEGNDWDTLGAEGPKDGDVTSETTINNGVKITKFTQYRKTKSGEVKPITGKGGLKIDASTISKEYLDNADQFYEIRLAELREGSTGKLAGTVWIKNDDGWVQTDVVFNKDPRESLTGTSPKQSEEKSNFSNGTNIDNEKSQAELESQAASSAFTTVLAARENRAKTRELYGLIESKFGKKVTNNAQAIAELMKPQHKLDLSSNDLDTIIEQVKHCR